MASTAPLEIKVVYDSSKRRRRTSYRRVTAPTKRRMGPLLLVGVLNLAASGGLYYATWWHADPFIYLTLMMKTPVDVDPGAVGAIFGVSPEAPSSQKGPGVREQQPEGPVWSGKTAQIAIPITSYSWLTLATIAACALSLASGAVLGRAGGSVWRRIGVVMTIIVALGLGYAVFRVWNEYGARFLPNHLRFGMGGLTLLLLMIGLSIGRGARGLTLLAAIVLILSAMGTAASLYVGRKCGAIEPALSTPAYLALAFAIHSVWGWILLVVSGRVRS